MSGAFPFRAAKPKSAEPAEPKPKPSMSFELPKPPPEPEPQPPPEVLDDEPVLEEPVEEEQDVVKRKPGRPKKTIAAPAGPKAAKFTFAEVLSVIGEGEPVLKVVAKITPVIEILKPEDRKRVVDILARLYG